jgi:PBP1b-binding outer membrane lipoprotein LpoB
MKQLCLLLLAVIISGCSGHEFEGSYRTETDNKFLNSLAKKTADPSLLVIGSDYIESDGERTDFDKIFVRESGEKRYLVFQDNDEEDSWKIINDKTIEQNLGFLKVKFIRID